MSKSLAALTFMLMNLALMQNAYAAANAGDAAPKELVIRSFKSERGKSVAIGTLVGGPASTVGYTAQNSVTQEALRIQSSPTPVSLGIIVDNSSLCGVKKIDKQIAALLPTIERQFHPDSRVSFLTFSSSGVKTVLMNRPLKGLSGTKFECEPGHFSASFEKAASAFLGEQSLNSPMPVVMWVFTSGNIRVNDRLQKQMKNAYTHVYLYNKLMEEEILPMTESQEKQIGSDRYAFSTVATFPGLPERWMRFEVNTNLEQSGSKIPVQIHAQSGKDILASGNFVAEVKEVTLMGILYQYRYGLMATAIIMLLTGIGILVFRYYRRPHCSHCKKSMLPSDRFCHFCAENEAYLVGNFNLFDSKKKNGQEVLRVSRDITDIGTHRKSRINMFRPKGRRRTCYARIIREYTAKSEPAFRIERAAHAGDAVILVNGSSVLSNRYLASGDTVSIAGQELIFYAKGNK